MIANVGSTDRILRILAGVILIALAYTGTIGAWGYLGVIAILTGAFRFCPAYLPFGIKTCATEKK